MCSSDLGSFEPGVGAVGAALDDLDVPIYAIDAVVRRSPALQATVLAQGGPRGGV